MVNARGPLLRPFGNSKPIPPAIGTRRDFLVAAAGLGSVVLAGCVSRGPAAATRRPPRLLFTSSGKTCVVQVDGTGERVLDVHAPAQVTWQPCGPLPDGRLLLLSMEARRDGPGRPFDQYYHQTPTHVWAHDLDDGSLVELATRERIAPFQAPQLILGNGRILMQVIPKRPGHIVNMNLDGSDPRDFTRNDEGLPYGFSLSPDGRRVAFHLASPRGYEIWTSDTMGRDRVRVVGQPGHLYFGPQWSPDGRWIAYQDCHEREDPGHDWSDVCVARADGSGHRVLTTGQSMWFAATYGPPHRHGNGSNLVAWTRDGRVLFPRRLPGTRVPWAFQANRPDTDHFNRDYQPEAARGGTQVCAMAPDGGEAQVMGTTEPVAWDFRCTPSPDGRWIAFCRARTGESPALWVMRSDGTSPRMVTRGINGSGADHPAWVMRDEGGDL